MKKLISSIIAVSMLCQTALLCQVNADENRKVVRSYIAEDVAAGKLVFDYGNRWGLMSADRKGTDLWGYFSGGGTAIDYNDGSVLYTNDAADACLGFVYKLDDELSTFKVEMSTYDDLETAQARTDIAYLTDDSVTFATNVGSGQTTWNDDSSLTQYAVEQGVIAGQWNPTKLSSSWTKCEDIVWDWNIKQTPDAPYYLTATAQDVPKGAKFVVVLLKMGNLEDGTPLIGSQRYRYLGAELTYKAEDEKGKTIESNVCDDVNAGTIGSTGMATSATDFRQGTKLWGMSYTGAMYMDNDNRACFVTPTSDDSYMAFVYKLEGEVDSLTTHTFGYGDHEIYAKTRTTIAYMTDDSVVFHDRNGDGAFLMDSDYLNGYGIEGAVVENLNTPISLNTNVWTEVPSSDVSWVTDVNTRTADATVTNIPDDAKYVAVLLKLGVLADNTPALGDQYFRYKGITISYKAADLRKQISKIELRNADDEPIEALTVGDTSVNATVEIANATEDDIVLCALYRDDCVVAIGGVVPTINGKSGSANITIGGVEVQPGDVLKVMCWTDMRPIKIYDNSIVTVFETDDF